MNPAELLDHCNLLLGRIEKIWKIALSILVFILTGALWLARLEWRVNLTASDVDAVKIEVKAAALDVSRIKGHMGITKTKPPIPPQQTAAATPPCTEPEPEQQTH